MSFRAIIVDRDANRNQTLTIGEMSDVDLHDGDVTVAVEATTVNYKDGLAITGKSPVIRKVPLVPGIDLAGTVTSSHHADWKIGDKVVLNGWGVGETHHGAYAQVARLQGDWLVPLPSAFTARQAMAIGTAGFTAMLSVLALEDFGLTPTQGAVLVTGAAGGVGSLAVALLAKLGWQVIASTGRTLEDEYLRYLGASEIINRNELSLPGKQLGKERWIAGVDAVGSHTLANAIASTRYGGAIAACGLAQGMDLPTSVAPFVLRGVSLLGINSVTAPKERRLRAWNRLASDLDIAKLDALTETISFDAIPQAAADILDGKIRGRVVVEM